MKELTMNKGELLNRAKRYTEAKINLDEAERELRVAQGLVKDLKVAESRASSHLCCTPLKDRTTTVLLDHPFEEDNRLVVTVSHEHHARDGDLWDVQVLEVTAAHDVESDG
jgi:hypothetical protein